MLTDKDDQVFDPFGGSCVTGEVAERLRRRWTCCELNEEYLQGAVGRFVGNSTTPPDVRRPDDESSYYKMPHPGILWNGAEGSVLPTDGGKQRILVKRKQIAEEPSQRPDEPPATDDAHLQMRLLDSAQPYRTDGD